MKAVAARVLIFIFGLVSLPGQAAPVSVNNLRMWHAPDHTRLVFDISGPLRHKVFTLKNPDRVVIDIGQASLAKPLPKLEYSGLILKNVRTGSRSNGELRIVLDLKRKSSPRVFVLKPFQNYGYRLVLDLDHRPVPRTTSNTLANTQSKPRASARASKSVAPAYRPARRKELVIAIDAGHGGEDPGAIGRRYRTYEKRVVLRIASELKKLVDKQPGMRAVLIRRGDYFIPLGKRVHMAQNARADMLISVHADSLPTRRARGASVYALSQSGSTSRLARILAKQENASDFIGGILENKDPIVQKVLVDLNHTTTIVDSLELGSDILKGLKPVGHIHSQRVEQAGFAVLKSPFVPSVLVETAFISNPAEEKRLRTRKFQRQMAQGIFSGIKRYVKRKDRRPSPIAATRNAAELTDRKGKQHIVRRGDTLSDIARRYGVGVSELRLANNMSSSQLRTGERLLIP
ncbi:MAG: N-acetylmuramoyl-L-alanine amidase [Acidiferrobacterales bacterium]